MKAKTLYWLVLAHLDGSVFETDANEHQLLSSVSVRVLFTVGLSQVWADKLFLDCAFPKVTGLTHPRALTLDPKKRYQSVRSGLFWNVEKTQGFTHDVTLTVWCEWWLQKPRKIRQRLALEEFGQIKSDFWSNQPDKTEHAKWKSMKDWGQKLHFLVFHFV